MESTTNKTRRKVIVVDDRDDNLSLVGEALRSHGFEVAYATSGQQAMDLIGSFNPELVLLDYNMPKMNGLETMKLLRQNRNYVAVIFMSASPDSQIVTECLEAGADDYLKKPFSLVELVSRVKVRFRIKELYDELQLSNQKLRELSEHDDLTGLFNMRRMYEKIDFELKRARRFDRQIGCVMMDMDYFKTINDGADHLFGSFVLRQVGKLIRNNIREVDLAARYGGDEFLIVLSEVNSRGALKFADRLRKKIEVQEFFDGKHSARRTASLGYAISDPSEDISAQDLVRRADHGLYQAKKQGRNCVVENKTRELAPEKSF